MVGCQSGPEREPLKAIDRPIQLERFMGDWYVLAHIPAFIEADAFNGGGALSARRRRHHPDDLYLQ
jgi:lipocalin